MKNDKALTTALNTYDAIAESAAHLLDGLLDQQTGVDFGALPFELRCRIEDLLTQVSLTGHMRAFGAVPVVDAGKGTILRPLQAAA